MSLPPPRAPITALLARLAPHLGPRLRQDAQALEAAASDASPTPRSLPAAVATPNHTDEVRRIAREAQALRVPLVPRGAGTGKVGGAIAGADALVVDLSAMDRILELDAPDQLAVVQPGVTPAALDAAARAYGLMYPPDPGSWGACTLGGTIATNAGSFRALKYGVTGRSVWGLEIVLPGGELLHVGRRSIKGVVGLDLVPLFVGSEGTLGFITAATLRLVPNPGGVATAWIRLPSVLASVAAATRMLASGITPCMLELLDGPALAAVAQAHPWAKGRTPDEVALLVQVDAPTPEVAQRDLAQLLQVAGGDARIAASNDEAQAFDAVRRGASAALKGAYPFKVSDDIAVPRSRMDDLYEAAQDAARAVQLSTCAYGHLGDGNLHVNWLCATQAERDRTPLARAALYRWALSVGGTVSGEHGVGLNKREALALELGPDRIALERRLKAVFDPHHIMNPGKVYPP